MENKSQEELIEMITAKRHDEIKYILEKFGVCIVPNVLNEDECNSVFNEMIWDFERRTTTLDTPFRFDDPSTWEILECFKPYQNMLYKHWGIGQSQYIYDMVRSNSKVIDCFESIWDTRELICSFDAISLHLPGELCNKDYFFKTHWYHFDQSIIRTGKESIQGLINMLDTNEEDATLSVFMKSHLFFPQYSKKTIDEFIARTGKSTAKDIENEFKDDFVKIKDLDYFFNKGCKELRITAPKGSLVLWDSRTLHQGSQPLKGRLNPNIRSVIYVCMLPAERISEYSFSKKIFIKRSLAAVSEGRTTNHWPQRRKLESFHPSSRYEGKTPDPGFWYPPPTVLKGVAWQLATGVYSDKDYDLID